MAVGGGKVVVVLKGGGGGGRVITHTHRRSQASPAARHVSSHDLPSAPAIACARTAATRMADLPAPIGNSDRLLGQPTRMADSDQLTTADCLSARAPHPPRSSRRRGLAVSHKNRLG